VGVAAEAATAIWSAISSASLPRSMRHALTSPVPVS